MRAMDAPEARLPTWLLRVPLVAVGCGLAISLAACGGSDPETAGDTASGATTSDPAGAASGEPACADIWVDGQELPRRYAGCTEDGETVKADKTSCSSGQVLVTYGDRFYAVLGGPVNETDGLSDDKDYRQAERSCLA
jgi:hypothetical protein